MARRPMYAVVALIVGAMAIGTLWFRGGGLRHEGGSNRPSAESSATVAAWETVVANAVVIPPVEPPPLPEDWPTFEPAGTTTPIVVTPPPWFPERVTDIDEPQEVVEFVRHLVGDDIEWAEWHVKLTTRDDIGVWKVRREPYVITRPLLGTPDIPAEQAVWIVGFRSVKPWPADRLSGHVAPPSDSGYAYLHYEGYVVLDRSGNIVELGAVDDVTTDGTPVPNPFLQIADIDGLREVK